MYFKTALFITYDEGKKFRLEDDTWRFMDWKKKTKKKLPLQALVLNPKEKIKTITYN